MLKLVFCAFFCVLFQTICCLQIPSYLLEDESYIDVQKAPLNLVKTGNYYPSVDVSTIGQCVFCNTILFNKYKTRTNTWSAECSYYTPERCMAYFEIYLNENDADKTSKHKRFDEIDKTGPGFRVLNQI